MPGVLALPLPALRQDVSSQALVVDEASLTVGSMAVTTSIKAIAITIAGASSIDLAKE